MAKTKKSAESKWNSESCSIWYGPALDAFWPLSATAAPFLLLALGPFYTKKPEEAFRRLREALAQSGAAAARAAGPASQERLKELASQIGESVDPGYYQRHFTSDKYRKTDTYKKKPGLAAETRPSPAETEYYEALLAWLYQWEPAALGDAERKLQQQLRSRAAAAGTGPARRAAKGLSVLFRQLSAKAAGLPLEEEGPLPRGPQVYPWPERQDSEAAAYLDLAESYFPESLFYLEGLLALRHQGNRYAIRELKAIRRTGRRFRRSDGGWAEFPAEDALPGGPEETPGEVSETGEAGSHPGDPLPQRLAYLRAHWAAQEPEALRNELRVLTELPSLDAGLLLYRAMRDASIDTRPCAEFLRQNSPWQGTAECYDMMLEAELPLSPEELRAGAQLGSLPCLRRLFQGRDPALPRLLSQALLRPGWELPGLEALVSLYRSLDDRQGHAAPLWGLHDALTEQLESFYRWEETLTVAERRARKDEIRQAEDALEQMQSDVEEMLRTLHPPGDA